MELSKVKKGLIVRDSYWPERRGRIVKVLKTRIHVKWIDGETWRYDLSHFKQFVEAIK